MVNKYSSILKLNQSKLNTILKIKVVFDNNINYFIEPKLSESKITTR